MINVKNSYTNWDTKSQDSDNLKHEKERKEKPKQNTDGI